MIGSMEMQHFLSNEPKIDCGNCRAAISKAIPHNCYDTHYGAAIL